MVGDVTIVMIAGRAMFPTVPPTRTSDTNISSTIDPSGNCTIAMATTAPGSRVRLARRLFIKKAWHPIAELSAAKKHVMVADKVLVSTTKVDLCRPVVSVGHSANNLSI